jgi:F-type H+-transporting ATPase subunit epsilon
VPLQVELVSPERILYEGEADMVVARTVGGGDIAFLPGHAPFLGALDIWSLKVQLTEGGDRVFAVHGGFVQVSDDRVTVLSDLAEASGDIDEARAQAALERAEADLARVGDDEWRAAEVGKDKRRAEARLQVVRDFAQVM